MKSELKCDHPECQNVVEHICVCSKCQRDDPFYACDLHAERTYYVKEKHARVYPGYSCLFEPIPSEEAAQIYQVPSNIVVPEPEEKLVSVTFTRSVTYVIACKDPSDAYKGAVADAKNHEDYIDEDAEDWRVDVLVLPPGSEEPQMGALDGELLHLSDYKHRTKR